MKNTNYTDTDNPNVSIHEPAPGHLLITGHCPRPVMTEEGYIVPPNECYIAPEVPASALLFALNARGVTLNAPEVEEVDELPPNLSPNLSPKNKGGRPRKETTQPEGAE